MPVILATQETQIRRIMVQSQTEQTVHKTIWEKKNLSQKSGGQRGLVEWLKL
jgi:hypothetical protein